MYSLKWDLRSAVGEATVEAFASRLEVGIGCDEEIPILSLRSLNIAYPGLEVTISDAERFGGSRLCDSFVCDKSRRGTVEYFGSPG